MYTLYAFVLRLNTVSEYITFLQLIRSFMAAIYYILMYEETFLQNTFVIFVDIRNATIDTVYTACAPPFDRQRDPTSLEMQCR